MFDLIVYREAQGNCPFDTWLESLRDRNAQVRIGKRLRQVQSGTLGDCKPIGEGVLELRIDVGAGYRIYVGRHGGRLVILLCGGDKSSQSKDIQRAKEFWADWGRRQI